MKYFSMFSGIGGFEYGICNIRPIESECGERPTELNLATNQLQQWECVGYSEIDKYATAIYDYHFGGQCEVTKNQSKNSTDNKSRTPQYIGCSFRTGGHKNYGNATTIIPEELPDFDLLIGGFPCQAFSIAGKRLGFDDTRGTLFFEIARILKVKRPRNFILENVKGLLSHDNGRTFKTIISTLVELGYGVEWQVLNSKNHGVPQNRERVFIIGHLGGEGCGKVFPITETNDGFIKVCARGKHQQDIVYSTKGILNLPAGTHGSAPHLTKIIDDGQVYRVYKKEGLSPTILTPSGGNHIPQILAVLTPDRAEKRQNGRRFKEDGKPSFTLTGQDIHGVYNGARIRRLTPIECERLQGFPDNWTKYGKFGEEIKEISDSQRYKTLGNAVTTNVVKEVVSRLFEGL